MPTGREKVTQVTSKGMQAEIPWDWIRSCDLQSPIRRRDRRTYEAQLGELQVEPLPGGFLLGEGHHVIVVAVPGDDIIF